MKPSSRWKAMRPFEPGYAAWAVPPNVSMQRTVSAIAIVRTGASDPGVRYVAIVTRLRGRGWAAGVHSSVRGRRSRRGDPYALSPQPAVRPRAAARRPGRAHGRQLR